LNKRPNALTRDDIRAIRGQANELNNAIQRGE